ncbi:MAG: hypothetical protein Q7T30_01500, partial [Planctomycetota bacterium]|nr:hypothetical protein [Planctomycetota bacterium]
MQKPLLLLVVALLVLAAAMFWLFAGEQTRAPSGGNLTRASDPPSASPAMGEATVSIASSPAEGPQRVPVATDHVVVPATLRGRVVRAEDGRPLAGCAVRLRGRVQSEQWLEQRLSLADFLVFHGESLGDLDPIGTGADGRFAFRFVPPACNWFELQFDSDGRVALQARLEELAAGADVDLGDVAMARGCFVHGAVVDNHGVPQSDVKLTVGHDPSPPLDRSALVQVRTFLEARSGPDGTFAFASHFVPGSWLLYAIDRQKVDPHAIVVRGGEIDVAVKVVLLRVADVETITGRVVDVQGRGLQATVSYRPASGGTGLCWGRADGSFQVERRAVDPRGPLQLMASANGYETNAKQDVDWGARDLVFVLQEGLGAAVAVRRADSGAPVERFALRLWSGDRPGASERWLQFRGVHADGVVQLTGLRRGEQTLVVQPADADLTPSSQIRFTVADGSPARIEVQLHAAEQRTVQVRRRDGTPVSGTRVELLEPGDKPATLNTWAFALDSGLGTFPGWARLLASGISDAQGDVGFAGPPEPLLAVRLLGPGHRPLVVDGVRWRTADGPLLVEVETGATLQGTLRPASAIVTFWQEGRAHDLDTDAARRERSARMFAPSIRLRRPGAGRREGFPPLAVGGFVIERDGTFVLAGIPPGTWEVLLQHTRSTGLSSSLSTSDYLGEVVGLRDGEVRRFDARIDGVLLALLAGTVQIDGQPLAAGTIHFLGRAPDGQRRTGFATTDSVGAFHVQLEPGTWRLVAVLGAAMLPAQDNVTLAPGQDLQRTFALRGAELNLRLLRADGTAIAGVPLLLELPTVPWHRWLPATGGDGRARLDQLPPTPLHVRCRPASLADAAVWQAYEA